MDIQALKSFLDNKVLLYNTLEFLETDPIQIPHQYTLKEDIEIAGFFAAILAWGNRKTIINKTHKLLECMGDNPFDFIQGFNPTSEKYLKGFVHRTFNDVDAIYFCKALQNIYIKYGGLEPLLLNKSRAINYFESLAHFKTVFFELKHPLRTRKHISNPLNNSAAKRLHLFLRWMVRQDNAGVDLGIWKTHNPAQLSLPLDVHTARIARKLKLLKRKQNDAKAVLELDASLRKLDNTDPVKYDYALFGLGIFENF